MGQTRLIITNVFSIASADVINRGVFFLFNVIVARSIAPDYFGIYTFAISLGFYAVMVGDGGIMAYSTKEIAGKDRVQWGEIIGNAIATRVALMLVIAAVGLTAMVFLPISTHEAAIYSIALLYPLAMGIFPAWISRGAMDNTAYFLTYSLVGAMALMALILFLILPQKNGFYALLWRNLAWLVGSLVAFVWVSRRYAVGINLSSLRPRPSTLRKVYPLGIAAILYSFLPIVPQLFLRIQDMKEDLAVYGASLQVIQILVAGGGIFAASLLPMFSRLLSENKSKEMKTLLMRHLPLLLIAALGVSFMFKVVGADIVGSFYGGFYRRSEEIVNVFSLLLLIRYLRLSVDAILIAYEKYGLMAFSGLSSLLIAIFWGALSDGLINQATAFVVSESLLLLINATAVFLILKQRYSLNGVMT